MKFSSLYRRLNIIATTPLHPQWLANRVHYQYKAALGSLRKKKVLDVGSGNSNINVFMEADNCVVRLDYPSTSSSYLLLPDVYGDARYLPFKDNAFDYVILFEVLEHVDKPSLALSEIHRVLNHGGTLIISVPFCYPLHDTPCDYWRFSKFGIDKLLSFTNFSCENIFETTNPFVAIFQIVNLVLLLSVKKIESTSLFMALLLGCSVYPICLLNNFLAFPLCWINWHGPLTLGYYAEAVAIKK